MTVLAVAYLNPKNAEKFEAYRARAGEALAKHGGRVAVVAPSPARLEGNLAAPHTMVLLEFPDAASVHAWHGDPELAETHQLRRDGADISIFVMDPAP